MSERPSGPAAPGALGVGPGPISILAEHMCIKGNASVMNRRYTREDQASAKHGLPNIKSFGSLVSAIDYKK